MKYINPFLITFFMAFVTMLSGVLTNQAQAQTLCPTQYGSAQYGTTACPQNLVVNKLVRNPITGTYLENLLRGDAVYSQASEAVYEINITNSGNTDFGNVQVEDRVESELKNPRPVEPGSVDTIETPDQQTLRFVIRDLKAGETRSVLVRTEVAANVTYPENDDRKCDVTNTVKVESSDQQPDEDSADLCILKPASQEVLGAKTLPQAGLGDFLPLMPFAALAVAGFGLLFKRRPAV